MWHLRRGPNRQLSLEELSNGHVGFERNMLRRRRAKDILEDKIGLAKPLFDIAATQLEVTAEIAPGGEILNQLAGYRLLLWPGIVDQRGDRSKRLFFIEYRG